MHAVQKRIAAVLREHQAAGWSGDEKRPHLCSCGVAYRAGELPDHQAERIVKATAQRPGDAS